MRLPGVPCCGRNRRRGAVAGFSLIEVLGALVITGLALAAAAGVFRTGDRKSTRLNSSHLNESRMPSSA